MWRIGIDEAGRGPVIGPLVVGALCLPEADLPLMHDAGVTDSKFVNSLLNILSLSTTSIKTLFIISR